MFHLLSERRRAICSEYKNPMSRIEGLFPALDQTGYRGPAPRSSQWFEIGLGDALRAMKIRDEFFNLPQLFKVDEYAGLRQLRRFVH